MSTQETEPWTDEERALGLERTGCWPENECWQECYDYACEMAQEQFRAEGLS